MADARRAWEVRMFHRACGHRLISCDREWPAYRFFAVLAGHTACTSPIKLHVIDILVRQVRAGVNLRQRVTRHFGAKLCELALPSWLASCWHEPAKMMAKHWS